MARSTFFKLSVFRIWSEIRFRCAANQTFPRIRDIFERCTRLYPAIGITLSRIINPSASEAFILHQIFRHNIIDYWLTVSKLINYNNFKILELLFDFIVLLVADRLQPLVGSILSLDFEGKVGEPAVF